jgi:hypothetical protein
MNYLFNIETALFLDSVTVVISDGEEAQMVIAEFLAGNELALEVGK